VFDYPDGLWGMEARRAVWLRTDSHRCSQGVAGGLLLLRATVFPRFLRQCNHSDLHKSGNTLLLSAEEERRR